MTRTLQKQYSCYWWRRRGSLGALPCADTHADFPTVHRTLGILLRRRVMMKIEVVCLKKFYGDDYQRDNCRKSGKRLCHHRLCHVHGCGDYAPYRVFYRRVELAVAELLICLGICLIFARIVFVEDEAAHAALFSVAVNIEARRLSEADIDIADFSDI